MAKFLVHYRDATDKEIEADKFEVAAEGKHYLFMRRDRGLMSEVAAIPTELVKWVERVAD